MCWLLQNQNRVGVAALASAFAHKARELERQRAEDRGRPIKSVSAAGCARVPAPAVLAEEAVTRDDGQTDGRRHVRLSLLFVGSEGVSE
jgi:hypothetical protein